jgi:ABC-type glycerol-3-phosphate transport system permease component
VDQRGIPERLDRLDRHLRPLAGRQPLGEMDMLRADAEVQLLRALIGIIPPVILYSFVQRYLARGLSFGAVKG